MNQPQSREDQRSNAWRLLNNVRAAVVNDDYPFTTFAALADQHDEITEALATVSATKSNPQLLQRFISTSVTHLAFQYAVSELSLINQRISSVGSLRKNLGEIGLSSAPEHNSEQRLFSIVGVYQSALRSVFEKSLKLSREDATALVEAKRDNILSTLEGLQSDRYVQSLNRFARDAAGPSEPSARTFERVRDFYDQFTDATRQAGISQTTYGSLLQTNLQSQGMRATGIDDLLTIELLDRKLISVWKQAVPHLANSTDEQVRAYADHVTDFAMGHRFEASTTDLAQQAPRKVSAALDFA